MRRNPAAQIWLIIALGFALVAISGVFPYPQAVRRGFQDARIAQEAGQPGAAAEALYRVAEAEPWRKELWQAAGQNALQAGNLEMAVEALERARAEGSISPDGLVALGDAYLQQGESADALQAWKAAIRTGAPITEAYDKAYHQQRQAGDLIGARLTLTEWLGRMPEDADPLYESGLLLAVMQPDQALPLLLEAAQRDPERAARVETLRKGLNLAAVQGDPVAARMQVGRSLGTLGEWDLAQVCFEEAVQLDPGYAEAWAFLGEARQQIGREGYADLERAVSLSPDSVVVQALLSVYYRRQGEPEQALPYLEKITEAEPDQALWQMELGNTLAETGDLVAALPYFQKAVQLEPASSLYWMELARFSITNDVDVRGIGLPAAREALQIASTDANVLDMNGQVMYHLGDMASAERFLQRALEIDAANAAAHLHLGQVYIQWQRMQEASAHLEAAARLGGNGPNGVMARRLLENYFPNPPTPVP